jgi:hypothetical protein
MSVSKRPVVLTLALAVSSGAARAQESEAARIRGEIEALRREFTERMDALEARLASVEARPVAAMPSASGAAPGEPAREAPSSEAVPEAAAPAPQAPVLQPPATQAPPAEAAVPAGAAGAGGPSGMLPVYGGPSLASKIFNPDVAVIGNFIGAAGKTPGGGEPSFEMAESEASFQAVVDPYARADFFLTFGPEEVGIEEAYVTFPTLPAGLLGRAGKMRDAFGKVNAFHAHNLPWVDRPLVTQNLVGGEEGLADSGISLSRLVSNPWLFLEATGQVYKGGSEVFQTTRRRDLVYLGHLRAYRDLGESSNLDLGGSIAYGPNAIGPDARTRLFGLDLTFRYRPLRRAIYRRLLARAELVWSRRDQAEGRASAFGLYGFGEYQFARRWFAGLRYDRSERADAPELTDEGASALLTFWPSEFSQVRTQFRHTRHAEGTRDNELLFQLLFSIGAHGAHPF